MCSPSVKNGSTKEDNKGNGNENRNSYGFGRKSDFANYAMPANLSFFARISPKTRVCIYSQSTSYFASFIFFPLLQVNHKKFDVKNIPFRILEFPSHYINIFFLISAEVLRFARSSRAVIEH